MNAEQIEELEALQFMLMEGELVRQDGNLLELQIPIPQLENRPFISFEIIWPENYPTNPLIFNITDNRLSQGTKDELTEKIAKIAEENAGGPATFNVYVALKDNLDNWGIVDELLNPIIEDYDEDFVSKPKQSSLSKSQKRKQYKFMNANGELQRGYDWVDIISHDFNMSIVLDEDNTEDSSELRRSILEELGTKKHRALTRTDRLIYILKKPAKFLREKFSPGSMKSSIFNILASTMGAGILLLPYAVNLAGLYFGIILIIVGMMFSLITSQLLIIVAETHGLDMYNMIGERLFGTKMKIFTEISLIISNYGAAITFLVLLKSLVPLILKRIGIDNDFLQNEYFWDCIVTLFIVFPLCLFKQMTSLKYTSTICFFSLVYLCFAITFSFFSMRYGEIGERISDATEMKTSWTVFEVFPIIIFAFTSQPYTLPIYEELQRKTTTRGFKVLNRSLGMALGLYLLIGIFGYLTFYKEYSTLDFPDEILNGDYENGNVVMILATCATLAIALTGCPLSFYPCRQAIFSFVWGEKPVSTKNHMYITTIMLLSALGISLAIPNIKLIVVVLGSILSPIVCFILPCLFYIKTFQGKASKISIILCWAIMVLASIFGLIGLGVFCVETAGGIN